MYVVKISPTCLNRRRLLMASELPIVEERRVMKTEKMDRSYSGFITMFWGVLDEAYRIYESHRDEKGDSWKNMPLDELRSLVAKEYCEWSSTAGNTIFEYHETIDLILSAMMLADRLSVKTGWRV